MTTDGERRGRGAGLEEEGQCTSNLEACGSCFTRWTGRRRSCAPEAIRRISREEEGEGIILSSHYVYCSKF